ncbi:TolB-like translocation protein [Wenyingzhuangia aestuarii]|uniref:hypothetical protein n=1 Tax=Wenyingzhuangia aestuarii TaxID=1647582 RepID=UPI001438D518|nr:hypothetical protein [Wenyingzhuangia aestuarii]NJB83388.1 hypothetical protein [Wenyingzhuangia aestuarii]
MLFKKIIKNCIYLLPFILWAQDQHEPQKWAKLRSTYVNIIYKIGQEKEAQQVANTISYVQKNNSKSIGYHYQPVNIVLRANSVESNGFVTYSPFRSEFFNTPPQEFKALGSTNWISTLAIHEYRHVQQFLNHKTGLTKFLYYLFGESGWAVGSILSVPNWYFEGDAVVMETALSQSGRGRLPNFTALQRALYKDQQIYSYAKLRNSSYKDLIPNHYQTGYQMLNYYRNHFDASRLDNIASKAAGFRFPFYGFSVQLKRETGLGTLKLYQKSTEENQRLWAAQRDSLNVQNYTQLSKENSTVASYQYPQVMEDGTIIALKNSFDKIPTFYQIDNSGNETKIATAIQNIDPYFNYHQHQLVYTGITLNPRYNNSSYNDVYVYDILLKTRKRITYKKRYFSPSFNTNNQQIIVAEVNQNKSKIVVLHANNGKIIKQIPVDGFVSRPQFIDEHHFVFIKKQSHQLAIFKIDENAKETQLTAWTHHVIDNIRVDKNSVYYSASFNGIDNIYETPLDGSSTIHQLTNANIGAYYPFVKDQQVYFTELTSRGSKISVTKLEQKDFEFQEPVLMDWNNSKTVAFEKGNILDKISTKKYYQKEYTSVFEDLSFHDWGYSFSDQVISVNTTATNLLNDFSMNVNTDIYLNENNSYGIGAIASYKKWFPVLNLGLEYVYRDFNTSILNTNDNNFYNGAISFNSVKLTPSISIPLTQIKGNYTQNFQFDVGYEYNKSFNSKFTLNENSQEESLGDLEFSAYSTQLLLSVQRRKATQNINTRAGFISLTNYHKGISGNNATYLSSVNRLYLPGILANHNSYVSFNYQRNDDQLQADTFTYARGYHDIPSIEANRLSYNYQLPLFYPDFGIAGITYFKRIRANLFADFSTLTLPNNRITKQNSIGFETVFDNTFFNISQAEIGIGYRGSFLLETDIQAPNRTFVSSIFISTTLF